MILNSSESVLNNSNLGYLTNVDIEMSTDSGRGMTISAHDGHSNRYVGPQDMFQEPDDFPETYTVSINGVKSNWNVDNTLRSAEANLLSINPDATSVSVDYINCNHSHRINIDIIQPYILVKQK